MLERKKILKYKNNIRMSDKKQINLEKKKKQQQKRILHVFKEYM